MSHFKFWAKLLDTENYREPKPCHNLSSDGPRKCLFLHGQVQASRPKHKPQYDTKWTNTSLEQLTGAINLVWAIHHFPYHLKMSFGPARRLGLGRLGSRYLNQIYWSKCRAGPKLIFGKVVGYGKWSQWPNPLIAPENLIVKWRRKTETRNFVYTLTITVRIFGSKVN